MWSRTGVKRIVKPRSSEKISPLKFSGSRRRIALIICTYSRVRRSGRVKGTPCQCSTTCGPEEPRPSAIRPPERSSSVAAVVAISAGEREKILATPAPSFMRVVTRTQIGQ